MEERVWRHLAHFGYNFYIVKTFACIRALKEGVRRTASIAAWFQNLDEATALVLVGGAAVELFTGGAYQTGDFDFLGRLSRKAEVRLREEGFRKSGRNWIHDQEEIFIDLPGSELDPGEKSVRLQTEGVEVLCIAPEELVVDRLAAWMFWSSSQDAVNALLIWDANDLDVERLEQFAERRGVGPALKSLREFRDRYEQVPFDREELSRWASKIPSES